MGLRSVGAREAKGPAAPDLWPAEAGWQQPVTAVLQSHDGYLWLGTYHGLVRFDGSRFTVFDSGTSHGLQNGLITSLFEDASNVLWIGHETGDLTRLQDGIFQSVNLETNWPGGAVEAITADEVGDIWLLNDSGVLYRLRDGNKTLCPGGASPTHKAVLARSDGGHIWVTANGSVTRLQDGKLVPYSFGPANANDFYERVAPARSHGLWVLANGHLRKWQDGYWVSECDGYPDEPGAVTSLLETKKGALLAGTLRDGLYLLTPGQPAQHFCRTNGLSHDWVRSLCEDHEGNIWIGTGGSFETLRPRKVQMLTSPDGWQGCALRSLSVLADGTVWVGTEGAGLYRLAGDTWTAFRDAEGVSNLYVWAVLPASDGRMYVGTWGGGLFVRENDTFHTPAALAEIQAPVASLYEGAEGELWIGTTSGLECFIAGKRAWSAGKGELLHPDVRSITEAADGTIWFGMSGGGLGALKDHVLKQFLKKDGLASNFILSLYADNDGTIWFGTADSGLGRFRNGKFSSLSTEQGLPNNVICNILDDSAGNLWLGSHAGIIRVNKRDLNLCADGAVNSIRYVSYGPADGLASLTCEGGFQPAACRARDGRLWFPTAQGLAVVDPFNVTTNLVAPPTVIEEFAVDGKRVEESRWHHQANEEPRDGYGPAFGAAAARPSLRLGPGSRQFEIRYTALSFTAPEKVRFKYKLEGLENGWVDAGARRVAPYGYLKPGDYTFRVIACNNDEIWNEQGASLAFTVLPYFYQSWWFESGSALSGAGILGAGVFWMGRRRLRRRLRQAEQQRVLERERSRIARDIHDDLGASLTRITMLSQTVRSELEAEHPVAADVDAIYSTARELTRAMDEIVWAVNPRHDTLDSVVTYLGRYAQHFLSAAGIRCRLDVPVQLPAWALTAEIRHNVFLAFKESLNNVVKHAGASEVQVSLEVHGGSFVLSVADNGCGFVLGSSGELSEGRLSSGNGLSNMKKRLEELGGTCQWETRPKEGTRVSLTVTIPASARRAAEKRD